MIVTFRDWRSPGLKIESFHLILDDDFELDPTRQNLGNTDCLSERSRGDVVTERPPQLGSIREN